MEIVDLSLQPGSIRDAAAEFLVSEFDSPTGWRDRASAAAEVGRVLQGGFARAVMDVGRLLGWVEALPHYNGCVWELHPIVVQRAYRRRGIGRLLVGALEQEVRHRGELTITLGTDDRRLGLLDPRGAIPAPCSTHKRQPT